MMHLRLDVAAAFDMVERQEHQKRVFAATLGRVANLGVGWEVLRHWAVYAMEGLGNY